MAEKRNDQRYCTCKNSKCMKLYCDCFAARLACGKNCRCYDCQNTQPRGGGQRYYPERRLTRQELIRVHKGCACRRSNCIKKYCDCFQSGILCRESCKCVDCQNNQSLTNRKVINQLRKNNSQFSNTQNSINLYPLYISQNSQHLKNIITQSNPLTLEENWLEKAAKMLYSSSLDGNPSLVFDNFLSILSQLEQNMTHQHLKYRQDYSQQAPQIPQSQIKQNSGEYQQQQPKYKYNYDYKQEQEEYEEQQQDQNINYSLQKSGDRQKMKLSDKKIKNQQKEKVQQSEEYEEDKDEENQNKVDKKIEK